jgi:hypothetical protein
MEVFMKTWHTFSLLSVLVLSADSLLACQALPPAAPEPATFALVSVAGGVVLVAGYLRRRKK